MGMGQAAAAVMAPCDDHVQYLQHSKHFVHLRQTVDIGGSSA